jgi:hypothetical protein
MRKRIIEQLNWDMQMQKYLNVIILFALLLFVIRVVNVVKRKVGFVVVKIVVEL